MILAAVMMFISSAYAHSFNTIFNTDSIKISAASESTIFKVGENEVIIELSDLTGNTITNAEVNIYYYMPSMPAMNYEVKSTLKGSKYATIIKPVMPGEWTADIKVKREDSSIKKVSVNFEVK